MSDPVVELQSGLASGVVEKHEEGFDYYAFKGIPFAEPPVGELRFEDPVPVKKWSGTRECKNYGPLCLQHDLFAKVSSYSEDCLNLNVFTRAINEKDIAAPVIVVIHGGLFNFGSGDDLVYGPEYLIRKDVVLVTFNYRLGVLGFLNLEDDVAPGNLGLKDQLMALQWVQGNIQVFGGDPRNITVLGLSAGGVAAQCLALSPLTEGLIHKLIVISNSMYNAWPWVSNPKLKAIKLCSLLGKELVDSKEIFDFLKTVDTESLLKAEMQLWACFDTLPFGLGVDESSKNPIVPAHPENLKNQAIHLPCLIGYNLKEGIVAIKDELLCQEVPRKDYMKLCDENFETLLKFDLKSILPRLGLSVNQVRRLYYKNEAVSEDNLDNLVNYINELFFIEGIHRFVRIQAEQSTAATYMYEFNYENSNSIAKATIANGPVGTSHFDDMTHVFKMHIFDDMNFPHYKKGTRQYELMEQMTEMWANFARYGRPTVGTSDLIPVHWLPIADGKVLRYLSIGEDIIMQSTLNIEEKFVTAKDIKV